MSVVRLSPLHRLSPAAPVIARGQVGIVMTAHGWDKLNGMTPAEFGEGMLGRSHSLPQSSSVSSRSSN